MEKTEAPNSDFCKRIFLKAEGSNCKRNKTKINKIKFKKKKKTPELQFPPNIKKCVEEHAHRVVHLQKRDSGAE